MATNNDVKFAFRQGGRASSANLQSDGVSLWSYGWWEIARHVNGAIITRKGSSYSTTTATKHRPGVYGVEAEQETPGSQGVMNL